MAAQWPQQQQQPQAYQGYSHAGYQQQYPQQAPQQQYAQQAPHLQYAQQAPQLQYAQQASQQQYPALQPGAYQPPNHPNPGLPYGQQATQPALHTCYNCGSAEHWAQNCPEPRREVPAGLSFQQNFPRPAKRQKTNAPIITKYPLPPHLAQSHGSSNGYEGASYSHPSYPQYGGYPGIPTPVSAQSPPQQQWQQSPSYQYFQQPNQQGQPYQHAGPYQRQSYVVPQPPTSNAYYSVQNSSQPTPQWPQHVPAYQPQGAPYQQPQVVTQPPYSSASPVSMASSGTGYHPSQQPGILYQGPPAPHPSILSQSTTPKLLPTETVDNEVEEDDLSTLDVPDIPSGGALIDLTGRPLSANFVVAEAIPLLPPEPERDGCCQSKYSGRGKPEMLLQNIRDTSYWDELSRDPIFSSINDDGTIIPIDYLQSMYDPSQANKEQSQEPVNDDGESNEDAKGKIDRGDTWDVMDSLEHALNAGRPKKLQALDANVAITDEYRQPAASNNGRPSAADTEAMLAALGVTGAPKPVRAPARPYPPPPTQDQLLPGSPNSPSRSLSRSPSRYSQSHENDPECTRRGSCSSKHSRLVENLPPSDLQQASSERSFSQHFEPPPPPPLPVRTVSFQEGPTGSPLSAESSHGAFNGYSNSNVDIGNGHGQYSADLQYTLPVKLRSEKSNGRKREYDNRDSSSEESDIAGRRQADDVTPKLKRRQPQVAEAYSRRW